MKKREGVKLGRLVTVDKAIAKRIARERRRGRSLREIADGLNVEGVSTAQGGSKWHASHATSAAAVRPSPDNRRGGRLPVA